MIDSIFMLAIKDLSTPDLQKVMENVLKMQGRVLRLSHTHVDGVTKEDVDTTYHQLCCWKTDIERLISLRQNVTGDVMGKAFLT